MRCATEERFARPSGEAVELAGHTASDNCLAKNPSPGALAGRVTSKNKTKPQSGRAANIVQYAALAMEIGQDAFTPLLKSMLFLMVLIIVQVGNIGIKNGRAQSWLIDDLAHALISVFLNVD
jgi:hypothetical protein